LARALLAGSLIAAPIILAGQIGESVLDRPLNRSAVDGLNDRSAAASMCETVFRVAIAAQLPSGCEETGLLENLPPRLRMEVDWSTPRSVLRTLANAHRHYAWQEIGGVIEARPLSAVRDPNHFLNEMLAARTVGGKRGLVEALESLRRSWDGIDQDLPGGTLVTDPTFELSFEGGSLLEFLNAVVRAHGAAAWEISYRNPSSGEVLERDFSLTLYTDVRDGVGIYMSRTPLGKRGGG
jgi:hypothetical protein